MRFGISATSLIVPKNFLTALRPVNVCAIFSLSIRLHRAARAPLRTAAFHRDHRDRRRGRPLLCDSVSPNRRTLHAHRDHSQSVHDASGVRRCRLPYLLIRAPRFAMGSSVRISLRMAGLVPAHPRLELARSPGLAALSRGFRLSKLRLLKLNLRTNLFERGLDLVRLVLGHAFLDVL